MGVDPDGDGGDRGIDEDYDYYRTTTTGDRRLGDVFECRDSRRRHRHQSEDSQIPVVTLNNSPLLHNRHTLTLRNNVVEFYGRKMDMNGGMGTTREGRLSSHSA